MMKKSTLLIAFAGFLALSGMAQKKCSLITTGNSTAESCSTNLSNRLPGQPNQVQALFDIQFNYNATDSSNGRTGMAGVVYTGTEFWVSRWASDTIHTFSTAGAFTGSFTVAGVTGIRALTTNGTNVYAGVNTTSIKVIDKATRTLTGTITAPAAVRHITYDSTANGGAGGFWIGNFSTDIVQISMTGATLQTILAATHGLTGMYGSAIDHWTAGGPYLWIFNQGGASNCQLVRLQLPSGAPTAVVHDVMADVGAAAGLTSALAGGMCIANGLAATRTLVGVAQGTPDNLLFGYELNDFNQLAVDAQLDSLTPSSPFIMKPLNHYTSALNWAGVISNPGASTLTSVNFVVNVDHNSSQVYTNTSSVNNLNSMATANAATSAGYTPLATGQYDVNAIASVAAPQADLNHANDTLTYTFFVTDTVFARDNGIATGSLGIGNGSGGILGQTFTTTVADQITSVTMQLNGPTSGDSVKVSIHSFGTTPGAVLASTGYYVFTDADTNGLVLTLPLANGPYAITPGTYFVGVNEAAANVTLGTSDFNFRPNASWVIFGTNAWAPTETYGFSKTFLLRMNVAGTNVGIATASSAVSGVLVYPNPATDRVTVEGGSDMKSAELIDAIGHSLKVVSVSNGKAEIETAGVATGVYFIKTVSASGVQIQKLIIR